MLINKKWASLIAVWCMTTCVYAMPTEHDRIAGETSVAVAKPVSINKASKEDLMQVKGINSTKAKNILKYRKKQGNFKSLEDLKNVPGFKKLKEEDLKAIQGQLSL